MSALSYHKRLERLACHEAGHAVVGWYYRRVIVQVALDPDKVQGFNTIGPMMPQIAGVICPHEIEQEIDLALAGRAAEWQIYGSADGRDMSPEDYAGTVYLAKVRANLLQDQAAFEEASTFPERIELPAGLDHTNRLFDLYGGHVCELVARPHFEHCIRSLAGALLMATRLQGLEVQMVINRAWARAEGDRAEATIKVNTAPGWGEWRRMQSTVGYPSATQLANGLAQALHRPGVNIHA